MKYSLVLAALLSVSLYAEGLEEAFKNATYDGHIRAGFQNQDEGELSIGGKLHMQTAPVNGISFGISFYTTQGVDEKHNDGVAFFSSDRHSYSILGEAYLQAEIKNTLVKVGRQEIDAPYADTDDIGMIPNTFEALTVVNSDIVDTTIVLAHLQKMSGVDAEIPEKFTKLNSSDGVQAVGITYEGVEDLTLQGWFYNASDFVKLTYLEADWAGSFSGFGVGVAGQYTIQDYDNGNEVSVYGINLTLGLEEQGLTFHTAYNKADSTNGQVAENFFGGGPFFISCEHLTMAEAGENGEAYRFGVEVDGGSYGVEGLGFTFSYLGAEGDGGSDLNEIDIVASYALNEQLSFDLIYSDTTDHSDDAGSFTNTRFFANYRF